MTAIVAEAMAMAAVVADVTSVADDEISNNDDVDVEMITTTARINDKTTVNIPTTIANITATLKRITNGKIAYLIRILKRTKSDMNDH